MREGRAVAYWQPVKDMCIATPIRAITVKGRAEPVMTYELRGLKEPT